MKQKLISILENILKWIKNLSADCITVSGK